MNSGIQYFLETQEELIWLLKDYVSKQAVKEILHKSKFLSSYVISEKVN